MIALTSNAGSADVEQPGPGDVEAFYLTAAKRILRPELLNRLDDVVLFDQLPSNALEKILDLELAKASARLSD